MIASKKKKLEYLRQLWGKTIDRPRDLELIATYHNMLELSDEHSLVDARTWDDLDLNSVFKKLDRNISGVGQQYLYHILHKYEKEENILKKRFSLFSYMRNNQKLREEIQLNLFNLKDMSSYFIAYLILNKSLPNTKYYPLFYLCPLLSILSLLLIPVNGVFLFVSLAVIITNLVLNKIFSNNIYKYFSGFSSLKSLITSALSITKVKTDAAIEEIEYLKEKKNLLVSLKKKLGYMIIDKQSLNELMVVAIEYLNMVMLFDVIAYYQSVNILIKNQYDIKKIFECVASLDTSISIASYMEEIPFFSTPLFNPSNDMSFKDICHPLIQTPVPNTIDNLMISMLITGSNMSGKTTFIKTIGINFILSQTLYLCFAREMSIPRLMVKTSINRTEDLEEGKSYFFVEVELLNQFISLSQEGNKYLFLIDEIFRGTNTLERLASSTAVLKYLNGKNRVLVTTHDIELQDLLKNDYKMFHFSEQVEDDKYFFNYKINEGPCSSGNAIKLLELMQYPELVTIEARNIAKELLHKSRGNESYEELYKKSEKH